MGGGDKCLRLLAGRPLLTHIIERVAPQVEHLILNANGDPDRFREYGLDVVQDDIAGFAGPLAGILAAMDWCRAHRPRAQWLASFPGDAPFMPNDLVARLLAAVEVNGLALACAASNGRAHPVVGLWSISLADNLRHAMVEEGLRKIDLWTAHHGIAEVSWPADPVDPFFNANRPDDLAEAERILAGN